MEKLDRSLAIQEERARNIRIACGLTQKQFGEILGISKSYVSDIENGYIGLSMEHINKICNYAEVSFDYMLGFSDKVNKNIIKIEKINLKILGENLKILRKELGITQEKMANKLNITRSLVTHYENGRRLIRTSDFKQMCEISGFSADWCLGKLKSNPKRSKHKKIKPKEFKELIEV